MTWSKTVPTTGSYKVDLPDIFLSNWEGIDDILSEEHYAFTSELSGRHSPGLIAVLLSGPTSAVTAVSDPISGSLVFDETLGCARLYDSTNSWLLATQWPSTRISVYRNADQTIDSGINTRVAFDTESFDILGEYNNTTYTFAPCAAGFFEITSFVSFVGVGGVSLTYTLYHDDSSDVNKNKVTHTTVLLDSNRYTMRVSSIISAAAGDKIYCKVAHSRSTSCIVEGGSTRTVLKIVRLS